MALDIAPPNFAGLAGLASGGPGNLNLSVPGGLGLQAAQIVQAQRAANQQMAMEKLKLRQADEMGLRALGQQQNELNFRQQQGQDELALEKARLAQQGQLSQQELGLRGQIARSQDQQFGAEMDMKNKAMAMEQQKMEMAKLMEDSKQTIKEKGAFAAYGRLAIDQAKTPEEAQQIKEEILNEAEAKGYITGTQAKFARMSSISQFKNMLGHQLLMYGAVKDYKDMYDMEHPKESANNSGQTVIERPDGTRIVLSEPTTKTQGKAEEDLVSSSDNLKELKSMYDSVPDSFFGAKAVSPTVTAIREWAQDIPGIGSIVKPSDSDKEVLQKYGEVSGQSEMMAMNVIKQLSGLSYTDSQLQFLKEIVPKIGPTTTKSTFTGKVNNLMRFYEQIKQDREELLRQGLDVSDPEFKQKLLEKMQNNAKRFNPEGLRKYLESTGKYNKEQIDAEIKRRGMM